MPPLDPVFQQALLARVRFYRELGIADFYRRPIDPALLARFTLMVAGTQAPLRAAVRGEEREALAQSATASVLASEQAASSAPSDLFLEEPQIPPRKPFFAPPPPADAIAPADHAAALQLIRDEIGDCSRCPLHRGRNKLVFGDGDPNAGLMFVGEGPGADEDTQGLPFVGRAGQLLNNMIAAMGLRREQVYIANIVKCRPPGNRAPEPEEANTCVPFLFRQIDIVRPQVLVALGATAATYLLGARQPLAGLRGRVHTVRGTRLIVTYHPAYLLRDPRQKKEAWADLQIAMKELGLKVPEHG